MHFAPKMHFDPMKREGATAILVDFYHTKLRFQEEKNVGTFLGKSKGRVKRNSGIFY